MKIKRSVYLIVVAFGLTVLVPFVSSKNLGAFAQNSVSGFVFGVNRQPMADLYVELIDDVGLTLSRTRTTGAGYYTFSGMSEGRFAIRAKAAGTDYEDGERSIEITNFAVQDREGKVRITAYDHQQADIYLRLRRGVTPSNVVVFVQDIPPDAKKLYEKAISALDNKRTSEGLDGLKAAIAIFPRYYAALERLAMEYIKMERSEGFQAAAVLFTNAVEVNSRGFKSWYGLAFSQYSLGNYLEALKAVEKAIELNAASPDAVFLSGVLMKKLKRYQEAEKQLLKAKELSKDTIVRVHWELATLYGNLLNRYAEAASELRIFLKAQPDSKDAENIKKLIADFEAKAKSK